ncbi:MAG: type II toxin-antitoxin system HicA family toxin [Muribaculum sp.]|nr:type II toxin-antitoxin system HicA family toxin [Muribaculum sp.]
MKYSELTRLLIKAGCSIVRHGSRHDIWKSPLTGETFAMPRHQTEEVRPGTLKSIMRKAGL